MSGSAFIPASWSRARLAARTRVAVWRWLASTPNIAARIEHTATPGTVVVGERTRRLVGDVFDFEDLGPHNLRGLSLPMDLFRAKGERPADSRFEAMHAAGLTPFVGRDEE